MRILMLLTVFGVVFTGASAGFAQNGKTPAAGVYKTVSVEDAKIVEAADFAVVIQAEKSETVIEIAAIEKAELQVAAGTNYRICMQVTAYDDDEESEEDDGEEDAEGITSFVRAVIFRNLKSELSLINWTIVKDCGKK